jgi:rubrerythrin
MTRAFTSLNPREALHIAIFIEERNSDIYHRFAEMFTEFRDAESLEIAAVFWDMAVEERRHSALLEGTYQEHFGEDVCPLTEEDLSDMIEVPKLENGDVFAAPEVTKDSARKRALKVALAAEKSAHDYYARLRDQSDDRVLRQLYNELSQMEDGHVVYLQNMLKASTTDTEQEVQ